MSDRFTIEMPKSRMPLSDFMMIGLGCLTFTGPLMVLASILGNNRLPPSLSALLLLSTLLGAICGALFVRNEMRKQRLKQAESCLRCALRKLGYVALEPIEMNGDEDRALIKDEKESALWNVSVVGNRVVCTKRS